MEQVMIHEDDEEKSNIFFVALYGYLSNQFGTRYVVSRYIYDN